MVSGPTPPFSGVMAARSVRARTLAARSPFKTPPSEAVPASMTVAPGLTISLVIRPGTPVAVMMTSKFLSWARSDPRWKSSTS